MKPLEITEEELRAALEKSIEAKLTGVDFDALVNKEIEARIGTVSFEKAAEMLQLQAKNPARAFREYARKYGIPVIHRGKAAFVRTGRIAEHLAEHELTLKPVRRATFTGRNITPFSAVQQREEPTLKNGHAAK